MNRVSIAHPGSLLGPLILEPTGMSQSMLSRQMGFNQPQPVNELIKGKRGITPKMALLLERVTQGQYCAEFWLLAQLRWELQEARSKLPRARLAMVEAIEDVGETAGEWQTLLELSSQLRA